MANKEPQNCWEFNNCPEEIRNNCSAYIPNMGRDCWIVASQIEYEGCKKVKGRGLGFCIKNCDWYKKLYLGVDK
ncbi:MAG: hypothetical protein KJ710_02165 [Candidatus Omnitrophica bacterium]|nr:hypothetical protein [Candidatus Omnitrophota bacterium]MBU1923054.1 hypothetical protein [Candidatus Omnitrophota bacterium]